MSTLLTPQAPPGGPDGGRRSLRPLTPRTAFRIAVLGMITIGVLGVLVVRLWFLQVIGGEAYAQRASDNIVRTIITPAPRGIITDRNGVVLAQNRPSLDLVAYPKEFRDNLQQREAMGRLAPALGVTRYSLLAAMFRGKLAYPYQPVVLARDIPPGTAMPLAERIRDYPGVQLRHSFVREYPQGDLAAHVLGYTGAIPDAEWPKYKALGYQRNDRVGLSGVEAEYERYLHGTSGRRQVEVDAMGNQAGREFGTLPPEQGDNLRLSIDANVQRALQQQLAERYAMSGSATAAAGVAMDPNTGEVLALASYPTFSPDKLIRGRARDVRAYRNPVAAPLLNRAIQGEYPPASTFKAITALSAMREGVLSPTELINSPSAIWLYKTRFKNFRGLHHGFITLPTALEVSSDTYFFQVGARFWKYPHTYHQQDLARSFGFGAPTRIDLPGEAPGRVPTPAWKKETYLRNYPSRPEEATWQGGDDINMAVGQGNLTVTPLQLAAGYAAIANGGKLLSPVVGEDITNQAGKTVRRIAAARAPRDTGITPALLAPVRQGLGLVADGGNGTARDVFRPVTAATNIQFAGKTGTAENKPHPDHAWFVGYAPATAPRIVVAVVVQNGGTGALVAAPAVCRTIAAYAGTRYNPGLCGVPAEAVSN